MSLPSLSSLCRFIEPRQEKNWDQTCGCPEGSVWFTSPLCTSDYVLYAGFSSFLLNVHTARRLVSVAFVPFGPWQCTHNVTTSSCKGVIPLMRCPSDLSVWMLSFNSNTTRLSCTKTQRLVSAPSQMLLLSRCCSWLYAEGFAFYGGGKGGVMH